MPTLSFPHPTSQAFPFANNAGSQFVCNHCVFILICVSMDFIFSNQVYLSQVTNVLNLKKKIKLKLYFSKRKIYIAIMHHR